MQNPRRVSTSDEWNNLLLGLPNPHVLQSWDWGAFKAKHGWTPTHIAYYSPAATCAAAHVLRRPLPHTPLSVMYVPKGPVLDYADLSLLDTVLAGIEQVAREQHAFFCKIDPDVVTLPGSSSPALSVLARRGWRPSREQIQFKNTVLLDLRPEVDQLLASMKPKTRYNIRLAQKRGVEVVPGTVADLELFYSMYAETSARDGFLIRQFPYYKDAWGSFMQAGRAQMLLAKLGTETIAGLILFIFGARAWYFYGASRSTHRELMPNHLLQWEAIRWARTHGCAVYDFWGAPDTLAEHAPMYGVYRFKEGFGGVFTQHIGAYDFVLNAPLYYLYTVVRPRYLARLRSRQAAGAE